MSRKKQIIFIALFIVTGLGIGIAVGLFAKSVDKDPANITTINGIVR